MKKYLVLAFLSISLVHAYWTAPNEVCLFKSDLYYGDKKCFKMTTNPTKIPFIGSGFNDMINSIEIGKDVSVELYEHGNFRGKKEFLNYSQANRDIAGSVMTQVSSMIIKPKVNMGDDNKICLYTGTNYTGSRFCGWYDPNGSKLQGISNSAPGFEPFINSTASITLGKNIKATLYDYGGFSGPYKEFTASSPSLGDFNYKVTSFTLEARYPNQEFDSNNEVCLYEHAYYKGAKRCFNAVNEYNNVASFSDRWWNDAVSSVKVGNNVRLRTFEHNDFKGKSKTYDKDNPFISEMNDMISSLEVVTKSLDKELQVCLYEHAYYAGNEKCYHFIDRNINIGFLASLNDHFSSLKVGKALQLSTYEHSQYKGRQQIYHGGTEIPFLGNFNDMISSLKIKLDGYTTVQSKEICVFKEEYFKGERYCIDLDRQTSIIEGSETVGLSGPFPTNFRNTIKSAIVGHKLNAKLFKSLYSTGENIYIPRGEKLYRVPNGFKSQINSYKISTNNNF